MAHLTLMPADMNNEIVALLSDNDLYNLFRTSRDMAYLCSLPAVWNINRSSELIPLYFLRNDYQNWIDFYLNVRKDYIYVVTKQRTDDTETMIKMAYDIKTAFSYILNLLQFHSEDRQQMLQHYAFYMTENISGALSSGTKQITISIARKNKLYTATMPYEYVLYEITKINTTRMIPDVASFPHLDSSLQTVFASPSNRIAFLPDETIYYGDINTAYLRHVVDQRYEILNLFDNIRFYFQPGPNLYRAAVVYIQDYQPVTWILVLISDKFIDGSDEFRLVALRNANNNLNLEGGSVKVGIYLKQHGRFYKLQDLTKIIKMIKNSSLE